MPPASPPSSREAVLVRTERSAGLLRGTHLALARNVGRTGPTLRGADLLRPAEGLPGASLIARRGPRSVFRVPAASVPGASGLVDAATCILKEEVYPFPALLRGIAAEPRALPELRNLALLRSVGIPAVEPLACAWSSFCGLPVRSVLLLEDFAGSVSLKEWSRAGSTGSNASPIGKEELVEALRGFVREVARLHAAGGSIGTLYGKNILVRVGESGGVELRLCDVPRSRAPRGEGFRFRTAVADLACLDKWACEALSARARRGLLEEYLTELRAGPPPETWIAAVRRRRDRLRHRTHWGRASRGWKRLLKRAGLKRYWPF